MAQTVVTFINNNINGGMSVSRAGSNWSVPVEARERERERWRGGKRGTRV